MDTISLSFEGNQELADAFAGKAAGEECKVKNLVGQIRTIDEQGVQLDVQSMELEGYEPAPAVEDTEPEEPTPVGVVMLGKGGGQKDKA